MDYNEMLSYFDLKQIFKILEIYFYQHFSISFNSVFKIYFFHLGL